MLNNISNRNHHPTALALTAYEKEDNQNEGKKTIANSKEEELTVLFNCPRSWPKTLIFSKTASLFI